MLELSSRLGTTGNYSVPSPSRDAPLRFSIGNGVRRSEVDRLTDVTGDIIVILDLLQSNELLSSMILSQTDDVSEVRVTVHHLQGSHLVWAGWVMVVIGSAMASLPRRATESSESDRWKVGIDE